MLAAAITSFLAGVVLSGCDTSYSAAILTYHDMIERRDDKALWFDCTPKELKDQIKWLKDKGFDFVSLDAVRHSVRSQQRFSKPTIAITFADNYEGFVLRAWPILKEEGTPLTMFVHTGHVGSRRGRPKMTWEQLRMLGQNELFNVGSQTVSHPVDLTKLTDAQLDKELRRSLLSLAKNSSVNRPIAFRPIIAYPNGKFDKRVSDLARKCGYTAGFTEEQKTIDKAPDIMRIPRYVHTKYREAARDVLASAKRNR